MASKKKAPGEDWAWARRHLLFASASAAIVLLLALTGGGRDAGRADGLAATTLLEGLLWAEGGVVDPALQQAWKQVAPLARVLPGGVPDGIPVRVRVDAANTVQDTLLGALRQRGFAPRAAGDGVVIGRIALSVEQGPHAGTNLTMRYGGPGSLVAERSAGRMGGPWWSILPPLFAVLIALIYGRVLLALGGAVLLGSFLVTGTNPVGALYQASFTYVGGALLDSFKLYVLGFTVALVGMVQVGARAGGNHGLIQVVRRFAKTARSTRIATAVMGLVVFFDDYANALVVGVSARPLTDRMRISREKLAYIVDSTAAPVAGLALISTWVGYEVGLFETLSHDLGLGQSGFEVLLSVLPMRFYCILALFFVFAGAWMGRDFGPMLAAEREAFAHGVKGSKSAGAHKDAGLFDKVRPKKGAPARWYNAGVPILLTLVAVVVGIAIDGSTALQATGEARPDLTAFAGWRAVFSEADNGKVLFGAAVLGSLVAIGMAWGQRILTLREALEAWSAGARMMGIAIAILILAWCIQAVTDDLGTSFYLVSVLEPILHPSILPVVIFLAAAAVAFATGTSWGTMGILLPAMIPLAWMMTQDLGLTVLCMGAVLDGAIFGDHCSPISDTTVMSSIATGCDHIAHVRTQIPYALTVMGVAALVGYAGVPMGLPPVAAYLIAAVLLIGILRFVGRPSETP